MEVQTSPKPPDASDLRFIAGLFLAGIRPDPRRTVAEWAEARRVVTEGAHEGPWRNHRAPYLVEPMEKATLADPCRRVTFRGSAQIGKTQVGLNVAGQVLEETPAKIGIVLPSLNSARMYNRDKLDPMLRVSPGLKEAVADVTSRDNTGSTTTVKRGARGAQAEIVTASSSKDLQSRSWRLVLLEEVSEFPLDVDNRGDPVDLALARTIAWRRFGEKVLFISTPSIKGSCRVSKFYDEGSQGLFHVPCPHCDAYQPLIFANLRWPEGQPAETAYACEECGALIEEADKRKMLKAGRWVHAHPDRLNRHASYHLNALYSPFTPWSEIAREADACVANPIRAKAFSQQWLGEPWDESFDLPRAEVLLLRRDKWQPGRVPPAVLFLMGATDVQGDRLVWAVWGFDRHFGQWLIDTGSLEGDPTLPTVWHEHDEILKRRWKDAWGKEIAPDVWGIDSGYLSSNVYAYVRRHASTTQPEVRALDGRPKWRLPPIGSPKSVDFTWNGQKGNRVTLWPVGTWDMKSELAGALRLTEAGPGPEGWPRGAIRFNEQADRAWLDEMLAEYCAVHPKTGERFWKKISARNEAFDLATYTRALARHATLQFTDADWVGLASMRHGPPADAQPEMAEFMPPSAKVEDPKPAPAPTPPPIAAPIRGRGIVGVGRRVF